MGTLSLPEKILVMKRPLDSSLESASATFGRQFKQQSSRAAQNYHNKRNYHCLATIISITYCLSYIKHEHFQRAYNNYDGLTSASVTSMCQNSLMNVAGLSQFHCPGSETKDFYPFHIRFPATQDSLVNI